MKRATLTMIFGALIAASLFAAEPVTNTAKAADIKPTPAAEPATPAATTAPTPVVIAAATPAATPVPVTASAAPAATVEPMTPPAPGGFEGTYEEPNEPSPSAEATPEAVEKQNFRRDKHFTIEQTLYTPSAFGTRIGYFVNENWRVMGEYSTISSLVANSSKEKNNSWAISANYSPADDDISPFFGAGFSSMDIAYNSTNNSDSVRDSKVFTGGIIYAGATWITSSPLLLSVEFDMYAGKFDQKTDDITIPADSTQNSSLTLSVMLGGSVGLVF